MELYTVRFNKLKRVVFGGRKITSIRMHVVKLDICGGWLRALSIKSKAFLDF